MTAPFRVLVASPLPVIREGLSAAVSQETDMIVVGVASSIQGIPDECGRSRPDVVVVDLAPDHDNSRNIREIYRACAPSAVVVLISDPAFKNEETNQDDKILFVPKTASTVEALQAIREAAQFIHARRNS